MFTAMHCFLKQTSLCFSSFDVSYLLLASQLVHLFHSPSVYSRTKVKLAVVLESEPQEISES